MISSTSNSQVKFVTALTKKAKLRKTEDLFVVEGIKMFSELPKEKIKKVYVSDSFLKDAGHKKMIEGSSWECVSDEVFKAMSDTQTPQGILAVAKQFHYTMDDMFKNKGPAHLKILEAIQDPGNLGTIIRAGEGAGITGVIMSEGTADICNPKTIRSTMGSVYRVPFLYVEDLQGALEQLKKKGVCLFAAHLKGKHNYDQEDYTGDIGFLIGNEAGGLSEKTAAMADTYVKIPMAGHVESLNAAVAASVLMFEAARQRRII